jgi:S1-C subfamily serine protease
VSYVKTLLSQLRERLAANAASSGDPQPAAPGQDLRPHRGAVWLGLYGDDFEFDGYAGVRVRKVIAGGPAAQAGLLGQGDPAPNFARQLGIPWTGHIILALDGKPVRNLRQLKELLRGMNDGQRVVVTVTVGPGVVTGETTVVLTRQP